MHQQGTMNDIQWKPYNEIQFSNSETMQFHVDTRDFNVSTLAYVSEHAPDLTKIKKYPDRFFHTSDEVKVLLTRYHKESGGERDWRYFILNGMEDWSMKYIRIHRTPYGLLVCDKDNMALSKEKLKAEVSTDEL